MSVPDLRDPSGALERATYAALTGTALTTAGGTTIAVDDDVPNPTPWPHCALEASTMADTSVKGLRLHESTVTFRLGSTYAGGKELSAAVDALLDRITNPDTEAAIRTAIAAEGFHLVWLRLDLVERYRDLDPSGRTLRYAAVRFRFHTQQTS